MTVLRNIIRNTCDLSDEEYQSYLDAIVTDRSRRMELIAYIAAVSAKRLSEVDIVNFSRFVHGETPKKYISCSSEVINIVGTGGGIPTFNVSTCSAFLAAAAGVKVLKSGSYSYNSHCGSLDLLKELGVALPETVSELEDMVGDTNIGFVHPKMYSPVLRRIAVNVHPLNLRDIGGFINKVGPLLAPFIVNGQVCGVSSEELVPVFARALYENGIDNSIAVCSTEGMDELCAIGDNIVASSSPNPVCQFINPIDYGMRHYNRKTLMSNGVQCGVKKIVALLKGDSDPLSTDTVILNAAQIIKLSKAHMTFSDCIEHAKNAIDCGDAERLFKRVSGRGDVPINTD